MKKLSFAVLLVVVAILVAACQGPAGTQGPQGPQGPPGPGLEPMTRQVQVEIYHQDSYARPAGIEAGLPAEERIATMYVWKPKGLYVFKGDTVELTVINNSGTRIHSLVMPDFGVNTGDIPNGGGSKTVTFVADKIGTFKFACGTPFDPTTDPIDCSADHKYQTGYFIVLDR